MNVRHSMEQMRMALHQLDLLRTGNGVSGTIKLESWPVRAQGACRSSWHTREQAVPDERLDSGVMSLALAVLGLRSAALN
jgi:hypothetical protein